MLLGLHVLAGARVPEALGQPEVDQVERLNGFARPADEEVVWLQVAVHDRVAVQSLQPFYLEAMKISKELQPDLLA